MKFFYNVLTLFCIITLFHSASLANTNEHTVLVSQDFTEILTKSLTAGSSIKTVRVIPASYSTDTHTNYMKKHWQAFSEQCVNADAVITTSGSWPEDPLYPWARRANIRIVPIDITTPLDHSRAGLPLLDAPDSNKQLRFVWYSPGNAARMVDIAATDLAALFPDQAKIIASNRDSLKRKLFRLRTKYEITFSQLDAFEAIGLTAEFSSLTDEFGISMVKFFLKPEYQWQEQDVQQLTNAITSSGVRCVIAKWQPDPKIAEAIQKAGACVVVPEQLKIHDSTAPEVQLLTFYETNLARLVDGLTK